MATTRRQIDSTLERIPVKEALTREPFRFQFFQAVRLLRQLSPGREMIGQFVVPSTEVVRFAARKALTFPASEVHSLEWDDGKAPTMTINFMGLTGPEGVLPLCYTEFVLERCQQRDTALADFLDIFNHRMVSLFYQAWEKYRFAMAYERGEGDRLSQHLADLIGLGTTRLQGRLHPDVEDQSLFYYSGLLAQRPHSAIALEQIIGDYFQVPVAVEQFAGRWYRLDKRSQTSLTESNALYENLGFGALVGDEVWDQQSLVRVRLGPLTLKQYLEFLPGRSSYCALRKLVEFYAGEQLDFEAQLVLKGEEAPGCELGNDQDAGPQLGWVSWIKTAGLARDPGDTVIPL